MGIINLSEQEKRAIKAVDEQELSKRIDQAIWDQQVGDLRQLPLSQCGGHVAQKLHYFEQSLLEFRRSKSSQKRIETRSQAEDDGRELTYAVSHMKALLEEQEKQGQLFQVYDDLMWPHQFSKHMSVRVSYRWRPNSDVDWQHGGITFLHEANLRADYTRTPPKRKPSAAQQARNEQAELSRIWEYLMSGALLSVKEFFAEGGDGNEIPETFQVTTDGYSGQLNNHSTEFWRDELKGV